MHSQALDRPLPHLTVATVVKRGDQYLMVEEYAPPPAPQATHDQQEYQEHREHQEHGELVYNQPAGHVESNETLLQAAIRETAEETGWKVNLLSLIGVYHYTAPSNGIRYVRVCFAAEAVMCISAELDPAIKAAHWLSIEQLNRLPLRSPLVLKVLEDYESGQAYPLALIHD